MTSPTQRALAHCKKMGWTAQVVEKWIPQTRRRVDLFGCIDMIVLDGKPGILGVQVTAGSCHASRRTKSEAEPRLDLWRAAGGRFEIWSFSKRGDHGKRKLWTLRVEEVVGTAPPVGEVPAPALL